MAQTKQVAHRRSVSLLPETKRGVDKITEITGVSGNRAIEQAVKFYSKALEQGEIVGLTVKTADGSEALIRVML